MALCGPRPPPAMTDQPAQNSKGKIMEILETGLEHSQVGRNVLEAQLEGKGSDYFGEIILDTFANKVTSTLAARTGALLQYVYRFQRTAAAG